MVIGGTAGAVIGGPLGGLLLGTVAGAADRLLGSRQTGSRRGQSRLAFTIAAIALAAKMARADEHAGSEASPEEFALFERLFRVSEKERGNARRFYELARRSPHGYDSYARQAAQLLGVGSPVLEDLLEALLMIATVDGVHQKELNMLEDVAKIMGFTEDAWLQIRARHMPLAPDDPYVVLGLTPGASQDEIRAAYRTLARKHHPDLHLAAGTPPKFIHVADARMAAINAAYQALKR